VSRAQATNALIDAAGNELTMENGKQTTQDVELDLISRYLLGELPEDQLTRLEERYFTDPSFLQHVETVEDDLIDAYIRQEMSTLERQHFENYFLASPGRRERVAQARALIQRLTQQSPVTDPSRAPDSSIKSGSVSRVPLPATRIAIAAALLVMFVGGLLLFLQNSSLRRQIERLQVERQHLEQSRQDLEQALAAERSSNKPRETVRDETGTPTPENVPLIASFTLTPGNPRSGESVKEIRLARPVATVRLDLAIDFSGDYKSARALLTRAGGPEIWSRGALPVRRMQGATVVSLLVPAHLLQPGDYTIALLTDTGISRDDVVADYTFRIPSGQKTSSK
jgi:anti-sigma factor RsiW